MVTKEKLTTNVFCNKEDKTSYCCNYTHDEKEDKDYYFLYKSELMDNNEWEQWESLDTVHDEQVAIDTLNELLSKGEQ